MTATVLIRWRLNEIMARHRVTARALATAIGVSDNAISNLRNSHTMPKINGERLEQLCVGISRLSEIREMVVPGDLIEYIPEDIPLPINKTSTRES